MMSCEYESLGIGTNCDGPIDAYQAYDKPEYIYPEYESKLGTDREIEEYCEEYCNNNQSCLGYLADTDCCFGSGTTQTIRCWVSIQRPTQVFNDNLNSLSTCMRKIDGSCSLLPTPSPTQAPAVSVSNDDDYSERYLSCADCTAQGCTYCKGEDFFNNPNLCICGDLSGGFFQGCSDFTFGADELTSKLDCTFGREDGEAMLAIVVIIPSFFLCVCLGCWYAHRRLRLSAQSNTEPTTTNNNTTSAAAAEYNDGNPSPYAPMATAFPISETEPSSQGQVPMATAFPIFSETGPSSQGQVLPSAPPSESAFDKMMNELP